MKYIFKNLLRFKFAVKISTILNVSSLALGILVLIVSPKYFALQTRKKQTSRIDVDGDGYGDPGKREYDEDDYYNVTCDPNSQLSLKALLDARKCLNITCKDIKC